MRVRRLTKREYVLSALAALVALAPVATCQLFRGEAVAYQPPAAVLDMSMHDMPSLDMMFQFEALN